jgi:hypothetical protein
MQLRLQVPERLTGRNLQQLDEDMPSNYLR